MNQDVVIRGTKDGLLILLSDELDFFALLERLAAKLTASGRFFRGAEVDVSIGTRQLGVIEHRALEELVQQEHGLVLRSVRQGESMAVVLERTARPPGSEERARGRAQERAVPVAVPDARAARSGAPADREDAPLVQVRTLRSGQAVRHRGDVVIIGDVNPGAEVVATGHIIVFGILRGVAHAGAEGDENAIVAALRVQPTQLRIGRRVAMPPENDAAPAALVPEVARILDGQIVIESRDRKFQA